MHCNQPFGGNGYSNGQYYGYNTPSLPLQGNFFPQIVGEGEVISVALPDGTFQFFFIPTNKWWTSQAANPYSHYSNINNQSHCNTYCSPGMGAWFVTTITNPTPNPLFPYTRRETPRACSSDFNLNLPSTGYRLKFHNDVWTSTTDMRIFAPSMRQYDYTISLPNKATAAVQVTTPMNNTVRHYEVTCSEPCSCQPKLTDSYPRAVSAMSLVETKAKSAETVCQCTKPVDKSCMPKCKSGSGGAFLFNILPNDTRQKRIKLERKPRNTIQNKPNASKVGCGQQSPPPNIAKPCKPPPSDVELISNPQPSDVICECKLPSVDKCMATYSDEACGNEPINNVEVQSSCEKRINELRYVRRGRTKYRKKSSRRSNSDQYSSETCSSNCSCSCNDEIQNK